jgi:hypothetical protein
MAYLANLSSNHNINLDSDIIKTKPHLYEKWGLEINSWQPLGYGLFFVFFEVYPFFFQMVSENNPYVIGHAPMVSIGEFFQLILHFWSDLK